MVFISANDSDRKSVEEVEDVVLANYSGEAFYPCGIKLSALQQCHLDDAMVEVFNRRYRTFVHCPLSPDDKEAFLDERLCGADAYGEIRPESFLEVLWRVGAKAGDHFYDLGCGAGKLIAIANILGLRATGVEFSRARCELAWQAMATLNEFGKRGKYVASFPALSTVVLDCKCESMFGMDFTDADIVYFCSLMFPNETVIEVAKIARNMKPGSRVISHHCLDCTCQETSQAFKKIGEVCVTTSWTSKSTMLIYEVLGNSGCD